MGDLRGRIEAEFESGGEEDGGFWPGECGAVDQLCSALRVILSEDSVLSSIFGASKFATGIERWDFYPVADYADLPKLYVYPTSVSSVENPTQIASETVTVFIAIRFNLHATDGALLDYSPGINTLLGHIRNLLYNSGETICLTQEGSPEYVVGNRLDIQTLSVIPEQDASDVWTATYEMACQWRVREDSNTGRIDGQPVPTNPDA